MTSPFLFSRNCSEPGSEQLHFLYKFRLCTQALTSASDTLPLSIPYDVAIKLSDVLEIESSLLYDDFSRFLATPYTEALKSVRTSLELSQKAFAERIEIVPSYYYKLEEGNRRPSRKVYRKICVAFEAIGLQTSLLWEHPLQ